MRKSIKKVTSALLALLVAFGSTGLVACGGGNGGQSEENVDTTKTQIYIGNQNYGFGDAWLISAKQKFEAEFANTEFEPGKKGVQVFYLNGSGYGANTLLQSISTQNCDIFFGESTNYMDYIKGGAMLDISDMVTEKLTAYGETRSISDKLIDCFDEYLNYKGKYYALPNYECNYMITYNIDYFETNNLYFKEDGSYVKSLTDKRSKGPDGVEGNYDDGLPRTFDEFFKLCKSIKGKGDTPICWPGGIDSYRNVYLGTLHNSIEGKESKYGYTFDGSQATRLIKEFDKNGKPVYDEPTAINESNGYEIYRQAGRYYAIKFFEEILENGYCTDGSTGSLNHLYNQADYINSRFEDVGEGTIAMLFDGNFWTNEATDAFTQSVADFGEEASKENARFGVMPIPNPTDEAIWAGKNSYAISGNNLAFIYAKTPENRIKACKAFLQYLYSDKMLKDYTQIVGTARGCDVTFTETELEGLTEYTRATLQYRAESDLVITASHAALYENNMTAFGLLNGMSSTLETDLSDAIMYLRSNNNKSIDSAKTYFEGIVKYYRTNWYV